MRDDATEDTGDGIPQMGHMGSRDTEPTQDSPPKSSFVESH